jgi:hypothetical protein
MRGDSENAEAPALQGLLQMELIGHLSNRRILNRLDGLLAQIRKR